MKATKAGIWIDHDHAWLIEFTTEPMKVAMIESPLHSSRKPNLRFGETRMHATEQRVESAFYKQLSGTVRQYKEVILFGPGTAKTELFNLLRENHLFSEIDIKVAQTDKLTQGQMQTFVRKHFSKHY